MAPPAHEDSLVFADEAKWLEKTLNPPDPPDTSALFQSPGVRNESTQIDQSTSPVFRHRSYSSSSESNSISPILDADRISLDGESTYRERTPPLLAQRNTRPSPITEVTLKHIPVLELPLSGPKGDDGIGFIAQDTQVIGETRSVRTEPGATQLVRRKSDSKIGDATDQLKGSDSHLLDGCFDSTVQFSGSPIRFHSDTLVIGLARHHQLHLERKNSNMRISSPRSRLKHDTQLIGYGTLQERNDIQLLPQDTQVIPQRTQLYVNDTQILPRTIQASLHDTQILVQHTESSPELSQLMGLGTQENHKTSLVKSPELRCIPKKSLDITKTIITDKTDSSAKLAVSNEASELKKNPEVSSPVTPFFPKDINTLNSVDSNQKETKDDQQRNESYDEANGNTKLNSIDWGDTQPITQIVNLEPVQVNHLNMESSPTKESDFDVDTTTLILSPRGAAGDSAMREEPTTQVVNTQEEFIDHNVGSCMTSARKSVFSSSQNDKNLNPNLSIISNEDYEKADFDNSFLYEDSVMTHRRKKQRLLDAQAVSNKFDKQGGSITEVISSSSHCKSSKEEGNGISFGNTSMPTSEPLPHKGNWSQSSSELEDFSNDAGFDLDMMESCGYQILQQAEDSHVEIVAPRKRRSHELPDTQSQPKELKEEELTLLSTEQIRNQDAVWAISQFKHHPGRVLSLGESSSLVEFSDLMLKEVKNEDLHFLDLRIGDIVLLKLRLGEFLVIGLACFDEETQFKCMRGFDTAIVTKKGRHGYSQGKGFQVAISQVYMEMGMWVEHQQRYQLFNGETDLSFENYSVVHSKVKAMHYDRDATESKTEEGSAPLNLLLPHTAESRDVIKKSDLFNKMVFFVTSVNESRKSQLFDLVTKNGGIFIDDEIKLFVTNTTSEDNYLSLKLTRFKGLKFGALLSDGYSRSAKYLQALALGWPILADSFVDQAIENPHILNNWSVYLLPAGHSLHINGLRSNDIYKFRENSSRNVGLNDQLSNNSRLLDSKIIIILDKKQDPKTLEMCDFIFHAFGAKAIKFGKTINEVDEFLKKTGTQNVMVYDNGSNEFVKAAPRKILTNKTSSEVKVIGWEWLVQCVISCYIWEPDFCVNL